jgi:hypothetical protein
MTPAGRLHQCDEARRQHDGSLTGWEPAQRPSIIGPVESATPSLTGGDTGISPCFSLVLEPEVAWTLLSVRVMLGRPPPRQL